jgi:hypothetical protein
VHAQQPTSPAPSGKAPSNLARFGVTFYRGIAAEYPNWLPDTLSPGDLPPKTLNADLASLLESYKIKLEASQKTKLLRAGSKSQNEFNPSDTNRADAVPTALLSAAANWSNETVTRTVQDQAQERAQLVVKHALTLGLNYDEVQAKIRQNNSSDPSRVFESTPGLVSIFQNEITENSEDRKAAESLVLEIIGKRSRTDIERISITGDPRTIRSDFLKHVQAARQFFSSNAERLGKFEGELRHLGDALSNASEGIRRLQNSTNMTTEAISTIRGIISGQKEPSTKIYFLQKNWYPGLGEDQKGQLL